MAGTRFTIQAGTAAVRAKLLALQARMDDLTPVMRLVAGVLADVTEEAFANQRDPTTLTPWEGLQASTMKRREARGTWPGKILQEQGQLATSITQDHGRDFAAVGSNLEYARIHQQGGEAASEIVARPFLGLSADGEEGILDILSSHLDLQ